MTVYPYTCPFWMGEGYECGRKEYIMEYHDPKELRSPSGCPLSREICLIGLDLNEPNHPKDAQSLIECIPDYVTEKEREAIYLNAKQFYEERYQVMLEGGNE